MSLPRPGLILTAIVVVGITLGLAFTGLAVADVEPEIEIDDDDIDGPVASGERHWHGQNLEINGSPDNASEVHELRTMDDNLVTEFQLDADGNAILRTDRFDTGDFVVYNASDEPVYLNENGTIERTTSAEEAAWTLIAQDFTVSGPDTVHTDESVEISVDSNRAGYPLVVSSEEIELDVLDHHIDGIPADTTGDGDADAIYLEASDYELFETDLTANLTAGAYDISFRAVDTGVEGEVTFEITDPIDEETLDAVWYGQTIELDDDPANADEIYEVRDAGGNLITQFILDETGNATLETDGFPMESLMVVNHDGEPLALDENGAVIGSTTADEATWTMREQSLDAEVTDAEVPLDEHPEILLSSNRAGYPLYVTSDQLDVDELEELFNVSAVDTNDDGIPDGVELEASPTEVLTPDLGGVAGPGAYNFTFTSADTGVQAEVGVEIIEPTEIVRISDSLIAGDRMDIVSIPLDLDGTDTGELVIESDDGEYHSTVQVRDGSGDGFVTVEMNTFLAGWTDNERDAFDTAHEDDEIEHVERDAGTDSVLGADELTLDSGAVGESHDSAILTLSDAGINDLSVGAAAVDAEIEGPGDVPDIGSLEDVAHRDQIVFEIDASITGFFTEGYDVSADSDDAAEYGAYLDLVEAATEDEVDLDVTVEGVIPDVANRSVYVIVDSAPMTISEEYEATFTLDDRNPGISSDEATSVDRSLNITERTAMFEDYDAENQTINIAEGGLVDSHRIVEEGDELAAAISGNATVAPGTELFVRMEDTDGNLLATDEDEVSTNGNWNARLTADEEYLEEGEELEFIVQDELGELEANVTGVVVEGDGGVGGLDHLGPGGDDDDADDTDAGTTDDGDEGMNPMQVLPLLVILVALGGAVYYVIR